MSPSPLWSKAWKRQEGGLGVRGSWPQGRALGPHLLGAGAHWLSWEARECQSWGHASLYSQTGQSQKIWDMAPP